VPIVIAVAGIVVLLVLLGAFTATRYKVAGPNEAFIITGRKGKGAADLSGQKVVVGGGAFVVPFVQALAKLPLSSTQIHLQVSRAPSQQGVSLNVQAVAVVKVGGDESHIRAAAQRFLGQTQAIHSFTTEVLEGELRAIVGTLTVEQIIQDRGAFAARVAEAAEASLSGQGLTLDSFSIKDVSDADGTYLRDIGRPEAAKVRQMADIAEAEANQVSEGRRIAAEEQIALSERQLSLRKSEIKAETDAAAAQAEASGPLAKAARDQEVLAQQAKVAEAQASVTEKQLEVEVRKPADAERYRIEQDAEAKRSAAVSEAEGARAAKVANAEAERRARELAAEAQAIEGAKQGEAERARRAAIAEAVRLEGEAQADAELAVGRAKAEAMNAAAQAFKEYGEAAVVEMLVKVLPDVARELAAPMASIDKLTVVSTDGASALPKAITENLTQVTELVKGTTGIDLANLVSKQVDGSTAPSSTPTFPES
jgi:flotillin